MAACALQACSVVHLFMSKAKLFYLIGTLMMPSMDVMDTTTTATDCEWSFLGAAGDPEEGLGSEERPEADMDPPPDDLSTESLCQVNKPKICNARQLFVCLKGGGAYFIFMIIVSVVFERHESFCVYVMETKSPVECFSGYKTVFECFCLCKLAVAQPQ